MYYCVKMHTVPLILCLLYVQNPIIWTRPSRCKREICPSFLSSYLRLFAGKWRKRGRICSVCLSFVKKWLFINETTDPMRISNKVKAYILFQFFVLCFKKEPLELFHFLAFCQFMFSILVMQIKWTWSLQSITY